MLRVTEYQVVQALESRQGRFWSRICRSAVVAGYAWSRAQHRIRQLRSDGTESLLAMIVALLYCADIRTGFVGRPRKGGGPWERYTLEDLAFFAYASKDDASVRKAKRALDVLINLGLAHPTIQVNRYDEQSQLVRGEPAVRRLNWEKLCELANTTWYLQKSRDHARQKEETARAKARRAGQAQSKADTTGRDPGAPPGWDASLSQRGEPQARAVSNQGPPATGDPPAPPDEGTPNNLSEHLLDS